MKIIFFSGKSDFWDVHHDGHGHSTVMEDIHEKSCDNFLSCFYFVFFLRNHDWIYSVVCSVVCGSVCLKYESIVQYCTSLEHTRSNLVLCISHTIHCAVRDQIESGLGAIFHEQNQAVGSIWLRPLVWNNFFYCNSWNCWRIVGITDRWNRIWWIKWSIRSFKHIYSQPIVH